MKRISVILLTALAFVIGAGVAYATAPSVSIDPIGPLNYATFPQVYNVTGLLEHSPNTNSVNPLTLYINDVLHTSTNPGGTDTTATFSLPWTITGPGAYTVKVTAKHGSDSGSDEATVSVSQTVYVGQYPAAPAIAAHYLQTLGVKAGSKDFRNIISLVAQYMGPTTEFDGLTADEAGYAAAVQLFVDGLILNGVPK